MNTTGNTIFISGGSAGIGLEIAKLFDSLGNRVIINGRSRERLDGALKQLPNAIGIQGDLSVESERIRIAGELRDNYAELNVIVNNAGEAYAYSLADATDGYTNAAKEVNTNYLTIIHFTELLLPHLKEMASAAVVNVSSIAALFPTPDVPTYSASKVALHFYTQSLRKSLAGTAIQVYEVIPPLVDTAFSSISEVKGIPPKEVADELLEAFKNNQFDVPVGQSKQFFK